MRNWSIILLVFIVVLSCQERAEDSQNSQLSEVVDVISNTKLVFAPDGRVTIFKIEAESEGSHVVLKGKTDLPEAKEVLLDSLIGRGVDVVDSIEVLPSVKLEGKTRGVVNNSVANIRSAPRHSGELATQALLGMPLKVLDQEGEWYLVQTPDDYISWIDHGGLVIMDDQAFSEWQELPKLIYRKTVGYAYKNTD
ncbi:MAG: SH3 domain-containing protein, partial [Cyclobacteriaceae bacterium]